MSICATCGNDYDNGFTVIKDGREFDFDSFECAMHKLAPVCDQCGCRIIGHGSQYADHLYCSAHCANQAGVSGMVDRYR
jgi:DNA-directed RNA polymerase subunit RPC12/RpoP